MKKAKKPLLTAIIVIAAIVLVGGAFFLAKYASEDDKPITRDDITVTEPATPDEPTAAEPTTEPPTEEPTVNSFGYTMEVYDGWEELSFDELAEINPDIYAWIYVPGTNIDYPVAQHPTDDTFYLSHNVYGEYQFAGTIFSQSMNRTDMTDPVTVMYGHNMLNGSMFATLHRFSDQDFFDEHTTCFIITKDKLYTYLIYAAYVYDNRHIMNSFNFDDEEVLMDYFNFTLFPRTYSGLVRNGISLDKDSRIITLSTCTGNSSQRYLVQGVLIDEQER